MSKTEVILTCTVPGLGAETDQVKVAPGYARNFLFPQKLAIPLTSANKRQLEVLRQRRVEREAHDLQTMTELSQALSKLTLVIKVKTGEDGKLFGSVAAGTISDELKTQFEAVVDKRKIHLAHPIKNLGEHDVELRLHPQVATTLKVRVESTTPIAKPPAPAPAETAPAKKERPKERGEHPRPERRERPKPPRGEKHERAEKSDRPEKPKAARPEKKTKPPKKAESKEEA